jgi:hypothetical protein
VGITGVRVTVGRTWRFDAGGSTCADVDPSAYRRRFDELKSPAPREADFGLPWPPYRSNVWRYLYSPEYQNTSSGDLVATLLPTRWETTRIVPPRAVGVEGVRHPFGLTTLAHVDLTASDWTDRAAASAQLLDVLRTSIGSTLLTDGVPFSEVPSLPGRSFEGSRLTLVPAGQFVALSGIHDEADGCAIASVLARLFDDVPDATKASDMRSPRAAISVRGGNVGLTLPADLPRAAQKLRCLHHNTTMVLAHLQNLSTILTGTTTASADWYQKRAASVLSHLYRRAPLAESGSVYKSRLPELWLGARGLGPAITALTPGLPAVP